MRLRGKYLCWLFVMMVFCAVSLGGCGGSSTASISGTGSEDVYVPEEPYTPNVSDDVADNTDTPDTPDTPSVPDTTAESPKTPESTDDKVSSFTFIEQLNGIWHVDNGELTYEKSTASYNSSGEILSKQVMDNCSADYVEAVSIALGTEVTSFEIFVEQDSTSDNYTLTISHDEEVRGHRATDYGFIAKMRRRDNGEIIGSSERVGGLACIVAMGPIKCTVTGNDTLGQETGSKDTIGYTAYRYRLLDDSTIEYTVDMITPEQVISIGSTGSSVIGSASLKLTFKRVN